LQFSHSWLERIFFALSLGDIENLNTSCNFASSSSSGKNYSKISKACHFPFSESGVSLLYAIYENSLVSIHPIFLSDCEKYIIMPLRASPYISKT
jgi:hypothetical protein